MSLRRARALWPDRSPWTPRRRPAAATSRATPCPPSPSRCRMPSCLPGYNGVYITTLAIGAGAAAEIVRRRHRTWATGRRSARTPLPSNRTCFNSPPDSTWSESDAAASHVSSAACARSVASPRPKPSATRSRRTSPAPAATSPSAALLSVDPPHPDKKSCLTENKRLAVRE